MKNYTRPDMDVSDKGVVKWIIFAITFDSVLEKKILFCKFSPCFMILLSQFAFYCLTCCIEEDAH